MFENKINNIMNRYKETLSLIDKLQEVYKPYDLNGDKRDDILYVDIRVPQNWAVDDKAICALYELAREYEVSYFINKNALKTPEQYAEILKKLNIQDYFNAITRHTAWNDEPKYKFIGNKFCYTKGCTSYTFKVLDALAYLVNGDFMSNELSTKLYKAIGQTFIFLGCKVKAYKNGNLQIEFSNTDLLHKFKSMYLLGVENAKENYKKMKEA